MTHVRQPAQMIAVGDSLNTGNWRFNIDPTTPSEFPSDIHRGGADFLFADGHVEYRLQSQMAFGSTAYSGWTAAQQQTARLWNNTNIGDPSVIP